MNLKTHLITGGCGFVGRNMVKRLQAATDAQIIFIDDLSVGTHPDTWLKATRTAEGEGYVVYD
ncbi:MAG: NAD-dependent epimerase/dehydratase family protein, partial [Flavobacteriales bacterium]